MMQGGRVLPFVRPVDAARMAAGPKAILSIGSQSTARTRGTMAKAGFPDPRFDRFYIPSRSPCRNAELLSLILRFQCRRRPVGFASHEHRPGDPGEFVGQRHGLIPNLGNKDPFHGGTLVLPVRRAARRDAPASGKPRNAAGGPMRPTKGRQLLSAGVVALLIRCGGIELRSAPSQRTKSWR